MGFASVLGSMPPLDLARALPGIALARAVCRDPDPGAAGPALARIDALLAGAESVMAEGEVEPFLAFGLLMAASAIAATEPVAQD